MSETREELEKQRVAIAEKIGAIETAERMKVAEALVGKCFRYKNSYSCPKKASDYWWLYKRIMGVTECGNLSALMFEIDSYGYVSIRPNYTSYPGGLGEEITYAEWEIAANKVQNLTRNLLEAQP